MADPQTKKYLSYGCNGTSLPHLQDYLAIKRLQEAKVLKDNDIFIPGHSFDMICGSHINPDVLKSNIFSCGGVCELIHNKHCVFWPDKHGQESVLKRINTLIDHDNTEVRGHCAIATMEWFNWQERQSKFIVNSVRAYELLGFRWRIPLWDRDLTEWFRSVPYALRLHRRLFVEAYEKVLAEPTVCGIAICDAKVKIEGNRAMNVMQALVSKMLVHAKSALRKRNWCIYLNRVRRYYKPPLTLDSPMAFEEYFAGEAETIGELLGLSRCFHLEWPEALRRHFRWRESWSVRQAAEGSNALLAAYLIKQYLQDQNDL
jgi:hypothetical protein